MADNAGSYFEIEDAQPDSSRPRGTSTKAKWVIAVSLAAVAAVVLVVALVESSSGSSSSSPPNTPAPRTTSSSGHPTSDEYIAAFDEAMRTTEPVMAWATSGGGLLALSASMGFANALNENGFLEQLSAVSSNSGGTWFLSQYSFSSKFHKAVNHNATAAAITWLETYYKLMANGGSNSQPSTELDFLSGLADVVGVIPGWRQDSQELAQYSAQVIADNLTWETFVTAFLKEYNGIGVDDRSAANSNRVFQGPDLVMVTTMAQTSQMDTRKDAQLVGDGCITDLKVGSPPSAPHMTQYSGNQATFPVAWTVSSEGDSWLLPQYSKFTVTQPWTLVGSMSGQSTSARLKLPFPVVSKIASMSSAAAGIGGAPKLLASNAGFLSYQLSYLMGADLAVCSGSVSNCQFPSVRFLDGAYTDNNAINLLVAHLQKKHGAQTPLRLAFLANDFSSNAGPHGALAPNFGAQYPPATTLGFPSVPCQVFASEHYQVHTVRHGGGLTYSVYNTTTVANQYFGVQPGTAVQILELNDNGNFSGVFGNSMLSTAATNDIEEYASIVDRVYNSLIQTNALETFFKYGRVPDGLDCVVNCND